MHSSKWSAITFLLIVLLGTLFLSGIPFLVSNHHANVYEGNTGRNTTPGAKGAMPPGAMGDMPPGDMGAMGAAANPSNR